MCTISWYVDDKRYHVFFNRDEQKNRPRAIAPSSMLQDGVQVLMPVDPQGQGSWISVNQYGATFALLNYYQGSRPKGQLNSRGQIIRDISGMRSFAEVSAFIEKLRLTDFAPFSLVCFFAGDSSFERTVLRWSGKQSERLLCRSPLISSGVEFDAVNRQRMACYEQYMSAEAATPELTVSRFRHMHASHLPRASAYSICMHRADAHTVSFSQVSVLDDQAHFIYKDGAPCANDSVLHRSVIPLMSLNGPFMAVET